jgi:hypothetical protein
MERRLLGERDEARRQLQQEREKMGREWEAERKAFKQQLQAERAAVKDIATAALNELGGKMDEGHQLYRQLVELLEQGNRESKERAETMIEKLQGQVNGLEELTSKLSDQAAEDGEEARKYSLVAMWVAFFCGLMNIMSFLPKDTDKLTAVWRFGLGCVLSALGVAATGIIIYSTLCFAPARLIPQR